MFPNAVDTERPPALSDSFRYQTDAGRVVSGDPNPDKREGYPQLRNPGRHAGNDITDAGKDHAEAERQLCSEAVGYRPPDQRQQAIEQVHHGADFDDGADFEVGNGSLEVAIQKHRDRWQQQFEKMRQEVSSAGELDNLSFVGHLQHVRQGFHETLILGNGTEVHADVLRQAIARDRADNDAFRL